MRVTAEEKARRQHAELTADPANNGWVNWLESWRDFTTKAQTEAAVCFSCFALRQRANSTLPLVNKRNSRSQPSDSPAKVPNYKELSEEEEEESEEEKAPHEKTKTEWATELRQAVVNGKVSALRRVLAEGLGDINEPNGDGKTALMLASERGFYAQVELLLEKGAEIERRDQDGWTALLFAVTDGAKHSSRCAEILLEHGANTEAVDDEFKMTAWLWACDHGRANCLSSLMQAECELSAVDAKGMTGRQMATMNDPPHRAVIAFIDTLPKKRKARQHTEDRKRTRS